MRNIEKITLTAQFHVLFNSLFNRVWATRQLCCLWILGIGIFIGNSGTWTPSMPVGGADMRSGIMLAYFANWGAELHMADTFNRWALPTSLHLMFAGITLLLTFLQLESPRYYIKRGKCEKVLEVLCKFRGLPVDHPYILNEVLEMDVAFQEEMEATAGMGWTGLFKELFGTKQNSYYLFLTKMAQNMACWSGGSVITKYAADLFTLVVAAITCALFWVDMAGRKRALIIGIALQTVAMLYIAIVLYLIPSANNPSESQSRASTAAITFIYLSSLAVNRALSEMLLVDGGLGPHGAFYFFGVVSILAAGRSLETIDKMFSLPWYKISLYRRKFVEEYDREWSRCIATRRSVRGLLLQRNGLVF
ncbi:hypothetical protein BJX65DRAFT_294386 [Aspergillus insuetus]